MKEHAIPQDITGYKFHIVGNMTLKQFLEVGAGVVFAFFIYKTNLISVVKWPLVLLSSSFGAALAFLPIAERPLDHWFVTFFSILYKPTKFFWRKESRIPDAFLYEVKDEVKKQAAILDLTPQRRQRISEFLKSVKTPPVSSPEDLYIKQRSSQLLAIFEDKTLKIDFSQVKILGKKPNLRVRIRSLVDVSSEQIVNDGADSAETTISNKPKAQQSTSAQTDLPKQRSPMTKKPLVVGQVATEIKIPKLAKIKVEKEKAQEKQKDAQRSVAKTQAASFSTTIQAPARSLQATVTTTQNANLPFPTRPTQENRLVGMILTKNNELIDGATVTISDESSRPVTAIKSNALGQFFISSRLSDGTYTICIKKDNFTFKPTQISLVGEVVEPLDIRSDQ